ncbi:MAG: NifU family protein [bacterium]
MKEKLEEVLKIIRPSLQADGGNIELVDFDEKSGIVKVKLTGACHHCPMAEITLKEGVEKILKEKVEEVKEVVAV